ncbi:MAG: hypothetical protein WBD51_18180, partial [Burkholderiaceae bacterium]
LAMLLVLATVPATAADLTNPGDANAAIAPLNYESPLADFRAFEPDAPMQSWVEANKRVGEIGGWRVYLKEATKKSKSKDIDNKGDSPSGGTHQGHSAPDAK